MSDALTAPHWPGHHGSLDLEALAAQAAASIGAAAIDWSVSHGEATVRVRADSIGQALRALRDDQRLLFETLVDICGVDHPERERRFDVVYHLLSMRKNHRLRLKLETDERTPIPSVIDVFPVANWFEREAFDMFGILFSGHPDLRRLLTDYGFEGHPLRKDFPMTGYVEVRYDPEQQRVVYEPVKLNQSFRSFDFLSPWEGMLPGDEKAGA